MEKPNSNKSAIFSAKRHLENSLGDDWQKYLSHLRKFFRNGNKIGKILINFLKLVFIFIFFQSLTKKLEAF